jgi:hypothetical protein
MNIEVDQLQLEFDGELDLRGFLGVDNDIDAGFPELKFVYHVKGNGTQEQYNALMDRVIKHSPNFNTMKNEVKMIGAINS